ADPHLRLCLLPGGDPGLAEVPVAGRELPQVRQRQLRHRQDLRLRRRDHREHQGHQEPGPQDRQRRRPRRGKRAGRRCLQMVLRLLARNAEHWLSGQLNAYLRDDDEYRAITRESIIRGLAGVITFTPAAITVALEPPGEPRVARALALLIDEINHTPPAIPGDNRPITYRITPKPAV